MLPPKGGMDVKQDSARVFIAQGARQLLPSPRPLVNCSSVQCVLSEWGHTAVLINSRDWSYGGGELRDW